MERGRNTFHGMPYEVWDVGDGHAIYIDFYKSETMAFLGDMDDDHAGMEVLGRWSGDATGGKAIRELGYEIEGDEHVN